MFRTTMNADTYMEMLQDRVWPVISQWDNFCLYRMVHNSISQMVFESVCMIVFAIDELADMAHMNGLPVDHI